MAATLIAKQDSEAVFGIGVSKKIGCHARRNRIRRQYRESLRAIQKTQPVTMKAVLLVKQSGTQQSYSERQILLTKLLADWNTKWADSSE